MIEKIIAYLTEQVGADEGEITADTDLFEEGVLDSFGFVQLLVWLEQNGMKLDVANFDRDSVSTPAKLADRIG